MNSGPADCVPKIATPDTVDAIRGAAGPLTRGEVDRDVGATVVGNLKRWELGSPEFGGALHGYRALTINHESATASATATRAAPAPAGPRR
ncbi:hypothetical protein [Actinacidiphila sp. ITFR-21]|uniref:hypothetical protein n=1 Tax=Actinacidiphila sp. ITFR-21 TaxID=3075199 RepID=UPI0037D9C483